MNNPGTVNLMPQNLPHINEDVRSSNDCLTPPTPTPRLAGVLPLA